jgi:hypothetical protein
MLLIARRRTNSFTQSIMAIAAQFATKRDFSLAKSNGTYLDSLPNKLK